MTSLKAKQLVGIDGPLDLAYNESQKWPVQLYTTVLHEKNSSTMAKTLFQILKILNKFEKGSKNPKKNWGNSTKFLLTTPLLDSAAARLVKSLSCELFKLATSIAHREAPQPNMVVKLACLLDWYDSLILQLDVAIY